MYQTTIKTELLFGAVKSTKYPVEKTRDESVAAAIAAYEAEGYTADQLLAIETSKVYSPIFVDPIKRTGASLLNK